MSIRRRRQRCRVFGHGVFSTKIHLPFLHLVQMERAMAGLLKTFVAIASLTVGFANPSNADWQYTKWGMTPAEVLAASGGKATESAIEEKEAGKKAVKLKSEHTAGQYSFDVRFVFNRKTNALLRVDLELRNPSADNCGSLHGALFARYGIPQEKSSQAFFESSTWLL